MRTLIVVFGEPDIKILLQLRDRAVEFLAERNAVELIEQRLVEVSRITLLEGEARGF